MIDYEGEFWVLRDEIHRQNCIRAIENLDLAEPKAVQISDKKVKRSDLQNRFLFGWVYMNIVNQLEMAGIVIPLANGGEAPYTKDVLHEIMKVKFLAIGSIDAKNGSSLTLYRSSTSLNKKEFCEFVDNIKKFVYQFWQITIPEPTRGKWFDYWKQITGRLH